MRIPMNNMFEENKMNEERDVYNLKEMMGTVANGRITRGVDDCAQILETTPESVMLCILPETKSNDISINIQHTLIAAYCWENDIPVHTLDNTDELSALLNTPSTGRKLSETSDDLSCVLISIKESHLDTDKPFSDWSNTDDVCLPI